MAQTGLRSVCKVVLIGGSAGSLEVLMKVIPHLSPNMHLAIVVILHRRNTNDTSLVDLLSSRTTLKVKEAEEKEQIQPSHIYIAPGDYHLLIEKDCTFSLDYSEKINYSRPSIDVTFETAAEALGDDIAAILLSGANQDGANGLEKIKEAGGTVAVQDPNTAEVPFMPKYALDHTAIDKVLKPEEIAEFIQNF